MFKIVFTDYPILLKFHLIRLDIWESSSSQSAGTYLFG